MNPLFVGPHGDAEVERTALLVCSARRLAPKRDSLRAGATNGCAKHASARLPRLGALRNNLAKRKAGAKRTAGFHALCAPCEYLSHTESGSGESLLAGCRQRR